MTMHVSASLRATGCAVAALIAAIGGQALADPAPSYDSLVGQSDTAPLNLEAAALAEAASGWPGPAVLTALVWGVAASTLASGAAYVWAVGAHGR